MRIQCPCGARYELEVTPAMAAQPVQFVCSQCGMDSSAAVNALIRQTLAESPPEGVLVEVCESAPSAAAEESASAAPVTRPQGASQRVAVCIKHLSQPIAHHCMVCGKGMCAQCMEIFGYVCSPHCKTRAEALGIHVPEFAGQRHVKERQHWRKVSLVAGAIAAFVVALLGVWFWYAWYGSEPSPAYAVPFDRPAVFGEARIVGEDQLVFLHGNTLARHDLDREKRVWSTEVLALPEPVRRRPARVRQSSGDEDADVEDLEFFFFAPPLKLHIAGSNIWVAGAGQITRYNFADGSVAQEITLSDAPGEPVRQGDELVLMGRDEAGAPVVQRLNLTTTRSRFEPLNVMTSSGSVGGGLPAASGAGAGLPLQPGAGRGQPLDPERVAAQAQSLSLAGRIALPVLLVNSLNQEKILDMLDEDEGARRPGTGVAAAPLPREYASLVPAANGTMHVSVRLIEKRLVQRQAMRDRPRRSALEGEVNVTQSLEVANEILNDLQRMRGGDTVTEDESRYLVTVRSLDGRVPSWSGEVVGPPLFFPLQTVNVLAAGKTLTVLDKSNRGLWQATLTHKVPARIEGDGGEQSPFGDGPCVERGDRLFVYDEAVLAAFDLRTGNAHWRLPTVGVLGLFFDEEGMLYVNSTTASLDKLKFSRQIDVTETVSPVVYKIDPTNGKTLWKTQPRGFVSAVSGKFIYAVTSDGTFIKLRRLNPKTGRVMWEYLDQRAPISVQFHQNSIQLVFPREVQVLKFLSF